MDSRFGNALVALALVVVLGLSIHLYTLLVLKPQRLRTLLGRQGIRGPPVSFLLGNINEIKKSQLTTKTPVGGDSSASHDCAASLFPSFEQWRAQYGSYCCQYKIIEPYQPRNRELCRKLLNHIFLCFL